MCEHSTYVYIYICVYKVYGGCIGVNTGFIVINGFWLWGFTDKGGYGDYLELFRGKHIGRVGSYRV